MDLRDASASKNVLVVYLVLCASEAQGVVIVRINGNIWWRKGFTFEART